MIICMAATASCGGGSGRDGGGNGENPAPEATTAEKIALLESSGKLPRLDRSASLAGPDGNANGIRDDIDLYISAQSFAPAQKAAVEQLARVSQLAITVDRSDRSAVEAVNLKDARAVNCTFLQFPASAGTGLAGRVAGDIERLTANTKERLMAYLAFAKASDGMVLPSPEGDTCE
jgi:hypothetical protein